MDSIDNFGFSATTAFNVSWIFGGYSTGNGADIVSESGFVKEGSADKRVTFRLLEDLGQGNFAAVGGPMDFPTNLTSGTELIFSAGPGNYVIQIDGSGENASGSGVGLYDIGITAVPLPAAGWLLIAGISGLVALRRKRVQ